MSNKYIPYGDDMSIVNIDNHSVWFVRKGNQIYVDSNRYMLPGMSSPLVALPNAGAAEEFLNGIRFVSRFEIDHLDTEFILLPFKEKLKYGFFRISRIVKKWPIPLGDNIAIFTINGHDIWIVRFGKKIFADSNRYMLPGMSRPLVECSTYESAQEFFEGIKFAARFKREDLVIVPESMTAREKVIFKLKWCLFRKSGFWPNLKRMLAKHK